MKYFAFTFVAWLALLLLGPVWRLTPFDVIVPNLAVVFAAYLGVTARGSLLVPTAAAVVIGYLADVLGGAPPGLGAFIAGLTCVSTRLLTTRLLVRGRGFVMTLLAGLSLAAALLTLALRRAYGGEAAPLFAEAVVALGSAALTGLFAAPLFRLCRSIDARFARTEREREGLREGYLN